MIVIDKNGNVVIHTPDCTESFAYVPKAMLQVLQMALSNKRDLQNLVDTTFFDAYIDFLIRILPNAYETSEAESILLAQKGSTTDQI